MEGEGKEEKGQDDDDDDDYDDDNDGYDDEEEKEDDEEEEEEEEKEAEKEEAEAPGARGERRRLVRAKIHDLVDNAFDLGWYGAHLERRFVGFADKPGGDPKKTIK